MLKHLLTLGYSPNLLPLAAPTWCLSPNMTAIASCNPPNIEAYDILSQNIKTNLNLRTPIFSIHILHLATARLDIPLLQHLINNPNTTPVSWNTSLAKKIFDSIHDVRTLDTKKNGLQLILHCITPARRSIFTCYKPSFPLARTDDDNDNDSRRQAEMILWSSRNELGYTPEELLEDGVEHAEVEQWKAFWVDADSPIYDVYSGGL